MIKAVAKHTVKNIWLYSVIFIISSFLSNRWKKSTEITWNRGRRSKHCLIIKQQVKSSQDIWVDVRPFQHVSHNLFCIFISLHSSLSLSPPSISPAGWPRPLSVTSCSSVGTRWEVIQHWDQIIRPTSCSLICWALCRQAHPKPSHLGLGWRTVEAEAADALLNVLVALNLE